MRRGTGSDSPVSRASSTSRKWASSTAHVGHHRLAAAQQRQVAENHVAGGNVGLRALAADARPGLGQQGEAVEAALANLLSETEDGVDEHHTADGNGALVLVEDDQGDGGRNDEGVVEGEEIARDDGAVVGGVGATDAVDLAAAVRSSTSADDRPTRCSLGGVIPTIVLLRQARRSGQSAASDPEKRFYMPAYNGHF